VDCLFELGFIDLTVLDISDAAMSRAKSRLGERASLVQWIVTDFEDFVPSRRYDL
jgi:hypothetical protein